MLILRYNRILKEISNWLSKTDPSENLIALRANYSILFHINDIIIHHKNYYKEYGYIHIYIYIGTYYIFI